MSANRDNPTNRDTAQAPDVLSPAYTEDLAARVKDRPHGDKLMIDFMLSLMEKDALPVDIQKSIRARFIENNILHQEKVVELPTSQEDPLQEHIAKLSPYRRQLLADVITMFENAPEPDPDRAPDPVDQGAIKDKALDDFTELIESIGTEERNHLDDLTEVLLRVKRAPGNREINANNLTMLALSDVVQKAERILYPAVEPDDIDDEEDRRRAWYFVGVLISTGMLPIPALSKPDPKERLRNLMATIEEAFAGIRRMGI